MYNLINLSVTNTPIHFLYSASASGAFRQPNFALALGDQDLIKSSVQAFLDTVARLTRRSINQIDALYLRVSNQDIPDVYSLYQRGQSYFDAIKKARAPGSPDRCRILSMLYDMHLSHCRMRLQLWRICSTLHQSSASLTDQLRQSVIGIYRHRDNLKHLDKNVDAGGLHDLLYEAVERLASLINDRVRASNMLIEQAAAAVDFRCVTGSFMDVQEFCNAAMVRHNRRYRDAVRWALRAALRELSTVHPVVLQFRLTPADLKGVTNWYDLVVANLRYDVAIVPHTHGDIDFDPMPAVAWLTPEVVTRNLINRRQLLYEINHPSVVPHSSD